MDIETKRRLDIIDSVTKYLEHSAGPIVSSRVVGSMSFAQNHAIRPDSDIDLDIFVPFEQLTAVNPFLELLHGVMTFESNEPWQVFDLIAIDCVYDGVAVNLWIINATTYASVASFKPDHLRYFSTHKPPEASEYRVFTGGTCTLDRHVQPLGAGYKSVRPTLYEGQVISENYVLNNMFFMFPIFGAEYSKRVVDEMWTGFLAKYPEVTTKQLDAFILDQVSKRFSPEFRTKLDQDIHDRLARSADIYKAAAVIIRDRKLLVSRSKGKSHFIAPGGKVEKGESVQEALIRELSEEQGITFSVNDIQFLGSFNAIANGHEDAQLTLLMDVYMVKRYDGELSPSAEVEENRWVDSQSAQAIELGSIFAHDVVPLLKSKNLID